MEKEKAASRIKNEETVEALVEKFTKAKTVVLTDQSGLPVSLSSELKKKLKAVEAESLVTKNTLLKIASKKTGHAIPDEALEGPTAALFAYGDEISPIKELTAFAKANEKPTIKVGFLGKDLLTSDRINQLAKLPSKETLRGSVVGGLYFPLYSMVGVLNANLRNLVYVLNGIQESKAKGGAN